MKYKEIFTLKRPSTDVPFHTPDSIFYYAPEDTTRSSSASRHFKETYFDTGKCDSLPLEISEDGLTLTYETIYNTIEAVTELRGDTFFTKNMTERNAYWDANKIVLNVDILPIKE